MGWLLLALVVCTAASDVNQSSNFNWTAAQQLRKVIAEQHEDGQVPSAGARREPPILVREHGRSAEPFGRFRREVPARMLLPLSREFFTKIAGPEKLIIVSWTTGAPADPSEKGSRTNIALNLALSIRKHASRLERHFAYISMDAVAHQVMQEHGFNSALCDVTCRTADLKDDIWKMRWYLMLTLTSFGLRALVVDADIVFLGDPLKEFYGDSDMEVMTDHFFPEKHLWEPWVRVEDHINTGFVLVKPSQPLRFLIADFLDLNWESEQGGVRRDGMDQRVFNHFIVRQMSADIPLVVGRYQDLSFGRAQSIVPAWPWRQVNIRILDPARIAHGMNFFWRRAHLLTKVALPPVAHVNGADPKEYFLRDRQVWFLDDWHDRFNESTRFLTYAHLPGTLKEDFSQLAAAVEVAKLLNRRLVLPSTMNCRNAPSYRVWNLDLTVQMESDSGNCTLDYFSWAKNFLDAHAGFVVESSVQRAEEFRHLQSELLQLEALSADLRKDVPVLRLKDVLQVRDALRQALRKDEWDSFTCIFQQFPHQVNVCRDDRYVGRFGEGAKCDPLPGQASCGFHGFTCCMSFWGYSEKLEIFTGARWDLPCNCGLGEACVKTKEHQMDRQNQQYVRHCCAHPLEPKPQEHCMLVPQQQPMTIYGDSHFYSSYLLNDFLDGRIDPQRALERCTDHRAGTLLDSDPDRALLHCGSMVAGLALWRGRYDRAFKWLERLHWLRRRPGAARPLSLESGQPVPETGQWKLRHDVDQLRYLARLPRRQQVSPYAPLAAPEFASSLADASLQLLNELGSGEERAKEALEGPLAALRPYLDRAVHVPHVERIESGVLTATDWQNLEDAFLKDEVAYLDDALKPQALDALAEYFRQATVWYNPQGGHLKAHLLDGLHAELLLQLAAELAHRMPRVLGPHRLSSLHAQKFDPDLGFGFGVHSLPTAVAVALWTTSEAANRDKKGNGFEIFNASADPGMSATERYAWSPQLEDDPVKRAKIAEAHFASTRVPYKTNRLVLWRGERFFRPDWASKKWRAGFRHRRVDLFLLYGEPV